MAWRYQYRQIPRRRERKKLDGSWPDEVASNIVVIPVSFHGPKFSTFIKDEYAPDKNESAGYVDPNGIRFILPAAFRLFAVGLGNPSFNNSSNNEVAMQLYWGHIKRIGYGYGTDPIDLGSNNRQLGEKSFVSTSSPLYHSTLGGIRVDYPADDAHQRYIYYARDGHFTKLNFKAFDYICIKFNATYDVSITFRPTIFGIFLEDL